MIRIPEYLERRRSAIGAVLDPSIR
jgi:hypothetical protein